MHKGHHIKSAIIALAASLFCVAGVHAQLSLTSTGAPFTVNFEGTVSGVSNGAYTAAGFQPSPSAGQLDSDAWAVTGWSNGSLAFGGTQTTASTDYTRGADADGGVGTAGFYAFSGGGISTGVAFGIQPGGSDFAPGTLTLRVQNNTGTTLTGLDLSYIVYVRNDQPRSNSFNFSYSTNDTSYTAVSALDLTSAATADTTPTFVSNAKSTTINGLTVATGGYVYLRWTSDDVSGSGARDEFALDNIVVTAIPEPSSLFAGFGMIAAFGCRFRRRRA
jgi:hypothetical protein